MPTWPWRRPTSGGWDRFGPSRLLHLFPCHLCSRSVLNETWQEQLEEERAQRSKRRQAMREAVAAETAILRGLIVDETAMREGGSENHSAMLAALEAFLHAGPTPRHFHPHPDPNPYPFPHPGPTRGLSPLSLIPSFQAQLGQEIEAEATARQESDRFAAAILAHITEGETSPQAGAKHQDQGVVAQRKALPATSAAMTPHASPKSPTSAAQRPQPLAPANVNTSARESPVPSKRRMRPQGWAPAPATAPALQAPPAPHAA